MLFSTRDIKLQRVQYKTELYHAKNGYITMVINSNIAICVKRGRWMIWPITLLSAVVLVISGGIELQNIKLN